MRILLADDHNLFRDALREYIERSEPDADVFVARDIESTMQVVAEEDDLDLIVLDLRMPGVAGLEGFDQIHKKYPDQKIAVMSGAAGKSEIQDCMDRGAVGFFPKTLSGKALLGAIRLVISGEPFLPVGFSGAADDAYGLPGGDDNSSGGDEGGSHKTNPEDFNLTRRETEVLSFLTQGASNKEIARELDLQEVTVKLHVRGVCRKLGAKNRTQAALKAQELGIDTRV